MATFATFIGIPVSAALGAASMTGAVSSGIISVLTKKYQNKLKKVTKSIDIITPALAAVERVVSGALKDGVINEEEFNALQTLHLETLNTLHLETLNKLAGVDHRMEAEHRSLVEKSLLEEIDEIKKIKEQEFNYLLITHYFECYFENGIKYTTSLIIFGKDKQLLRSWQNLAGRNLRQLKNGYLGKHSASKFTSS